MQTVSAIDLRQLQSLRAPVINVETGESVPPRPIPGSRHVPVARDDFVERVQELVADKRRPLVLYAADGDRRAGQQAVNQLERAGFTQVCHFRGGARDWQRAGRCLATSSSP